MVPSIITVSPQRILVELGRSVDGGMGIWNWSFTVFAVEGNTNLLILVLSHGFPVARVVCFLFREFETDGVKADPARFFGVKIPCRVGNSKKWQLGSQFTTYCSGLIIFHEFFSRTG